MRLKTKNTNIFHAQTTKNTKNKTTKKKKQTTTIHCCYFYRIRVHYTVLTQHTTPHTTPTNQQSGILPTRGDLQNNTRAALDTQQHATQQNKPSKPEHKHVCCPAKPLKQRPRFVSSTPKTTHMKYVRYLSSPENKNLPPHAKPTRDNKKLSPARC